MSAQMRAAWTAFATNGDPGWPAYDTEQRLDAGLRHRAGGHRLPGGGLPADLAGPRLLGTAADRLTAEADRPARPTGPVT